MLAVSQLIISWLWVVLGLLGRAGHAGAGLGAGNKRSAAAAYRSGEIAFMPGYSSCQVSYRQLHGCQPQVPNS